MNYKDVVDRIRQVVFDHKMLVDFGYGQLSDIKTRAQGDGLDGDTNDADYPYCFLNPQPHVRTETQITYNFNMILMDMAREEEGDDYQNFLAIQSDCIQYIDDIVARLYYHYKDQPEVQFNYSYNPFYERFQDQLAGATANLSIIVPTNINDCIAPFNKVLAPFNNATRFSAPEVADINFTRNYNLTSTQSAQIVEDNRTAVCVAPVTRGLSGISLSREAGVPLEVGSQLYESSTGNHWNPGVGTYGGTANDYMISIDQFCTDFDNQVYQLTFNLNGTVKTKTLVSTI